MQINNSMLKELKKFMRGLISSSFAKEFRKPVDVIGLGLSDYDLIITCPMDLGTMKNKLHQNQYLTVEDFKEDFELLCKNCYTYNTNHNDYVPQQCKLLENAFVKYILTFEERVKKGQFEKKRRAPQEKPPKKEKPPKSEKPAKTEKPPKQEENKLRIAIYPPTNEESHDMTAGSNLISLNLPNYVPQQEVKVEKKVVHLEEKKHTTQERKIEIKLEEPVTPSSFPHDEIRDKILKAITKLQKREFFQTYPSINKEDILKAVIEQSETPTAIFKDIIVKMCTDDADIEVIEQFHHFWCSKVQQERPIDEILEEFNEEGAEDSEVQEEDPPETNTKISLNIAALPAPEEKKKQTVLEKEASKIILKLDQFEPVPQEDQEDQDDEEEESNSQEFIESQENENTKIAIKVDEGEQEVAPVSLKVQIPLPPIPQPKLQMMPSPRIPPVHMMQMMQQYGTHIHPAQSAPNITKTPQVQLNEYLQRTYLNFRKDKQLLKIRKSEFVKLPPAKWKKFEGDEVSQPYSLIEFCMTEANDENST